MHRDCSLTGALALILRVIKGYGYTAKGGDHSLEKCFTRCYPKRKEYFCP